MAQLNWTYYSLSGIPYSIDMYHGDDSGHLILFVNSEIILIEFNQKESNSYSFYIENQLLEFSITEESLKYVYELIPQLPEAPSDLKEEKYFDEHFWIPLIIIIIALNLIFLWINHIF